MSEIKTFRVKGTVKRGFRQLTFTKEIRGINEKEALEKFYNEVGSRNRIKRSQIKNITVEEIDPNQARSAIIRTLAGVEG